MEKITSRQNKHIKQILRLKQKKHRDKDELFFIEGKKMLQEALKSSHLLVKIFTDALFLKENEHLKEPLKEIENYLLDSRLMNIICDTDKPQGIAAIVKKPKWDLEKITDKEASLILLDRIADPGNMGTIIRTAWAFGIDGVLLTNGCVDPFNPKVVRASMGGILSLPVAVDVSDSDLRILKEKGYSFLGASPYADTDIYDIDFKGRVIIVIGSEAKGLSQEIEKICTKFFKIPLNPAVDSLNAATACAIITNELYRQRRNISSL